MKTIEVQSKKIEDAIEEGLEKLGASYDDVDVEILENGGMFKKARIKLTLKHDVHVNQKSVKPESKPEPSVRQEKQDEVKNIIPAGDSKKLDICVRFVEKLLEYLDNNSTITTEITDRAYKININGDEVGRLIGKGGEALNALQTLVSSVAISNSGGDARRVFVNVEDYREKRGDTLKTLALKKAEYVKSSGRSVKLEPMSPRDRAIIHTAIQEIPGVKSFSTGEGAGRRLVITLDKGDKVEN